MATTNEDYLSILIQFGENISSSKDKKENEGDYKGIISFSGKNQKTKTLTAQLIPRFFKFFPQLSSDAINAILDLCEDEDINVRIQAIRGLPFLCKENFENLSKIADVLCQLLISEENQENIVVQNSLMQVLRQDPKESLTALFKQIENGEDNIREKIISFFKEKVIPNKDYLFQPKEEMENYVTELVKGLKDLTKLEFEMFFSFLKSFSIFKQKITKEKLQKLIFIIENQVDWASTFSAEDLDQIERFFSCFESAVPLIKNGASFEHFFTYINETLFPNFDKLPDEKKIQILKFLCEISSHFLPTDSRTFLPKIVNLANSHFDKEKEKEIVFVYIEAILYIFHQLAAKTPNATNSLCGYHFFSGQPSDNIGQNVSEIGKVWIAKICKVEEETRKMKKKLSVFVTLARADERKTNDQKIKSNLKIRINESIQSIKCCENIERLLKPLKTRTPEFLDEKKEKFVLSWNSTASDSQIGKVEKVFSPPKRARFEEPQTKPNDFVKKQALNSKHVATRATFADSAKPRPIPANNGNAVAVGTSFRRMRVGHLPAGNASRSQKRDWTRPGL